MFRIFFTLGILMPFSILGQTRGIEFPDVPIDVFSGKTYAVIVGIDSYQSPKIPQLKYAVSDAKAFEEFLESNAGGRVPKQNIRLFINDSATTGRFKKLGLSWVKNVAKKGDRVFLYFSGHGLTVSGGDSYFLANNLSADFDVVTIEEAGTQALYQLKTNTIRPLHDSGVQVILIMDACRSFLEKSGQSSLFTSFNPNVKSAEMKAGDYMFLSSSNGQISSETAHDNMKHGIFTYYLLSGLYGMADNGRNADGRITFNKLKNYITQKVSDYSNESQIPIIEKTDDDNPILAIVDSFLLTRQINAEQGSLSGALAINVNKFSNSKLVNDMRIISLDTSETYSKFMGAIRTGKIWGDDGSVHYFDELEKMSDDPNLLKDAVLNLSALLIDSGQTIINAYISADDESLAKLGAKNLGKSLDTVFLKGVMIFDILYRYYSKYYPDDPDTKTYLQHFYFMSGRSLIHDEESRKNSLEYLQNAYDLNPNSLYILHAIDLILSEDSSRIQEALENEKKVVAKYNQWPFALRLLGNIYQTLSQNDSAIKYYKMAINASPNDYESLFLLAYQYYHVLRFDLAKKCVDSAKPLLREKINFHFYKNWEVYTELACISIDLNQYDSARYFISKALSENPKNIDRDYILFKWGGFYHDVLKKYDSAIYCLSLALELNPNFIKAKLMLASCYAKIHQPKLALNEYSSALKVTDNEKEKDVIWNELGRFYEAQKNYDSAIHCYNKIKYDSLQYALCLGSFYFETKNIDSAIVYNERAIKKMSNYFDGKLVNLNYSYLTEQWVNLCFKKGVSDKTASLYLDSLYKKLYENNIQEPRAWVILIKALDKTKHKKTEAAYAFLYKIVFGNKYFDSSSAECWYYTATWFYLMKGLPKERIIPFLEKAISLNPTVENNRALLLLKEFKKSLPKKK